MRIEEFAGKYTHWLADAIMQAAPGTLGSHLDTDAYRASAQLDVAYKHCMAVSYLMVDPDCPLPEALDWFERAWMKADSQGRVMLKIAKAKRFCDEEGRAQEALALYMEVLEEQCKAPVSGLKIHWHTEAEWIVPLAIRCGTDASDAIRCLVRLGGDLRWIGRQLSKACKEGVAKANVASV